MRPCQAEQTQAPPLLSVSCGIMVLLLLVLEKPSPSAARHLVSKKKRGVKRGDGDVVWPVLGKDRVGLKPLPRGSLGIDDKA